MLKELKMVLMNEQMGNLNKEMKLLKNRNSRAEKVQ